VQSAGCRVSAATQPERPTEQSDRYQRVKNAGRTSPKSVVLEPALLQLRVASPAPAARRATPSDPPHAQRWARCCCCCCCCCCPPSPPLLPRTYSSAECLPLARPSTYPCPPPAALRQLVKRTLPSGSPPRPPGPVRSRLQPCTPISSGVQASHGHTWRQGTWANLCSNRPDHGQHGARFRPSPMPWDPTRLPSSIVTYYTTRPSMHNR
jgi:hypothetical protein